MKGTPQDSKGKPPPDTITLHGGDVIGGLNMDEEVELTVKCRLVEEGSRDYDGEKRPNQRFQISKISKGGGSKAFNSAARAQAKGKGIAG